MWWRGIGVTEGFGIVGDSPGDMIKRYAGGSVR